MQVNQLISASAKPIAEPQAVPAKDAGGLGFDDLLDMLNPLQHLPVVGTIYRAITGDEISPPAKIAGDTLFGGVYGFLGAVGSVAFESIAGESIEKTLLSFFETSSSPAPTNAQLAYQSALAISADEIERVSIPGTPSGPLTATDLTL